MRRDDEQVAAFCIRQRINLIAAADSERAASVQEKRHVRAQTRCDFDEPGEFDRLVGELQQGEQSGSRVA